jgi:hypothetical protein
MVAVGQNHILDCPGNKDLIGCRDFSSSRQERNEGLFISESSILNML